MPSSFQGKHGKIVYVVEAKICRSWHLPSAVQKEIKFVSKAFLNTPQNIEPKFKLQQKIVYRCDGKTKTCDETLFKEVGDTIRPNSEQTASRQLKIPSDAIATLRNCDIISVEYQLKVYLDISFAFDPEVVFPLVIIPYRFAAIQPGEPVGPYPPGRAWAPSYSNYPSLAFPTGSGMEAYLPHHFPYQWQMPSDIGALVGRLVVIRDQAHHEQQMSYVYKEYSRGLRTHPWGAPVLRVVEAETCPPILTACGLPVRKLEIH
nr:PREDICTED: arrestin domain-containing protein 3-like [Pundamilia nyererei]